MKISRIAVPLILTCLLIPSMPSWTAAGRALQGPVDPFFLSPTHYSCQGVNELVPSVSLALACDLYFPGCIICLLTSPVSRPALLRRPRQPLASWRVPAGVLPPQPCWAPPASEHRACHSGGTDTSY